MTRMKPGVVHRLKHNSFIDSKVRLWAAIAISIWSFAVGCRDRPRTTATVTSKSPDGRWVAKAMSEQWAGPGNDMDMTTVSLERATDPHGAVEVLKFDHNNSTMGISLLWSDATHLKAIYTSTATLDFQAIKCCGGIEIELRDGRK